MFYIPLPSEYLPSIMTKLMLFHVLHSFAISIFTISDDWIDIISCFIFHHNQNIYHQWWLYWYYFMFYIPLPSAYLPLIMSEPILFYVLYSIVISIFTIDNDLTDVILCFLFNCHQYIYYWFWLSWCYFIFHIQLPSVYLQLIMTELMLFYVSYSSIHCNNFFLLWMH